jgi:hypothetical protein
LYDGLADRPSRTAFGAVTIVALGLAIVVAVLVWRFFLAFPIWLVPAALVGFRVGLRTPPGLLSTFSWDSIVVVGVGTLLFVGATGLLAGENVGLVGFRLTLVGCAFLGMWMCIAEWRASHRTGE